MREGGHRRRTVCGAYGRDSFKLGNDWVDTDSADAGGHLFL